MGVSYVTTRTSNDWERWGRRNAGIEDGTLTLASKPALDRSTVAAGVDAVAVDGKDTYTIQEPGRLCRANPHQGIEQCLWRAASHDAQPEPVAVCVLGDRIYVGDRSSGDLFVVSSRLQRLVGRIETTVDSVTGLAGAGSTVYVLDGVSEQLGIVGSDGTVEPVVTDLAGPVDLAATEGSVFVLEFSPAGPRIREFADTGGQRSEITVFELETGTASCIPTCLGVTADRTLVVAGQRATDGKGLLLERQPGDQSFAERDGFDGSCRALTTSDGQRHVVVGSHQRCYRLVETEWYRQHQGRYQAAAYRQFDAGAAGLSWHRLTVDCDRPTASTGIRVRYTTSDEPALFDDGLSALAGIDAATASALAEIGIETVWELTARDPRAIAAALDGVTVALVLSWHARAIAAIDTAAEWWEPVETPEPTDTLLSGAEGRYLRVKLELTGEKSATPRVDSLTAYCPRQSYLRYLPSVYEGDDRSTAFLEQYLSVFETLFTDIEGEIDGITAWLDPEAIPGEQLSWLAEWLAVDLDETWPRSAQRELLARAPELARKRGTKAGLRAMLGLYLRHVEPPDSRSHDLVVPETTDTAGAAAASVTDGGSEHGLVVLESPELPGLTDQQSVAVFAGPFASDDHREAVEGIIDRETPAHVDAGVTELTTEFSLDGSSLLSVNTRLTTRAFELGGGRLGADTVLGEREIASDTGQ